MDSEPTTPAPMRPGGPIQSEDAAVVTAPDKRRIAVSRETGGTMNRKLGIFAVLGYIATIVAANYAIHHIGTAAPFPGAPHTLPVGFGLVAPSGVYFVALALVLRNVVQRQLGRWVAVVAILIGAAISWWVADPGLAKASAAAFLLSEALDMAIYTPLRRYGQYRAVLPASLAGGAVDSALFLWIAFGSETFWKAQMLGKTWGVLAAVAFMFVAQGATNIALGVEQSEFQKEFA